MYRNIYIKDGKLTPKNFFSSSKYLSKQPEYDENECSTRNENFSETWVHENFIYQLNLLTFPDSKNVNTKN